jgi:hypothetical protein
MGARIEDERNRTGMPGGQADKNALPNAAIPIGNLLAILKVRVEDINQTMKYVSTVRTQARAFDARE